MKELSMHVLDIAQNSIVADASLIEMAFIIDEKVDTLTFTIKDNGIGMDESTLEAIKSPFYTSRTTRKIGLGVPMLIGTAQQSNGYVELSSQMGKGTLIKAVFGLSNIDRPPMGDLAGTMLSLVYASENTDVLFSYKKTNDESFEFDTREIKKTLDGVSINEPAVMSFIREYLVEGIETVNNGGVY